MTAASGIGAVYVAGHRGMVGSAIVRRLKSGAAVEFVLRERSQLDLLRLPEVEALFSGESIGEVYLAAAKVGGIHANSHYPADFIHSNLSIETNVIRCAYNAGVNKLLFLGSSCIYPARAEQPMREESLLTGRLEPTNEPYAVAKIAGIKICESYNRQHGCDYRSVMPTNLYGPGDNFHPRNSHVIPGLMRRFHEAKCRGASKVAVWGSGNARREFMHVDDMAAACVHVMNLERDVYWAQAEDQLSHINVGTGTDCTIRELAETIAGVVGYEGGIEFDRSKPDGPPRKLLDVTKLRELGWESTIGLEDGLRSTYEWFLANEGNRRGYEEAAED